MTPAGKRNKKMALQKSVLTTDSAGNVVTSWIHVKYVWVALDVHRSSVASEREVSAQERSMLRYNASMLFDDNVDETWRLVDRKRFPYNITGVHEPVSSATDMTLIVERGLKLDDEAP